MNRKTALKAIVVAFLTLSSSATLADCRQELRELGKTIGTDGGKTKLNGYVCRLTGANDASVAIESITLSNIAASVLVTGGAENALKKVFGPFVLVGNDVSKEFKTLVDRFGTTMSSEIGVSIADVSVSTRQITDQIYRTFRMTLCSSEDKLYPIK